MITFTAYGVPATKGSARAFLPKGWKRPIITNTNRSAKAWESLIAEAAGRALMAMPANARGLIHGAASLTIRFYLPRPKSLPRGRVVPHIKAPDVDKLARCTIDALSGVLYRDDAQLTTLHVLKAYAGLGETPRAEISLQPLEATESLFCEVPDDRIETRQTEETDVPPGRPAQ